MIANIKILEKYCKNYTKIENYQEALKSPIKYDLHHRREISESKSRKDLKKENLYYNRPPEELIFLEHGEHTQLHKKGVNHKGENNPNFGKHCSGETRQRISEAKKGIFAGEKNPMFGKHLSAETKQKLSDAKKGENNPNFGKLSPFKGKHWHLENGRRIYTD